MTILVSACLLGTACRYDGRSKADAAVTALLARHALIPVCGEIFGGLPTPRTPAERRGARVMTKDGRDVTDAYRRGAEEVVRLARLYGARAAILKERSPSCGSGEIYDDVLRHAHGGLGRHGGAAARERRARIRRE